MKKKRIKTLLILKCINCHVFHIYRYIKITFKAFLSFSLQSSTSPTMISLFCLYGYSLSIYIPVAILWTIQISWLQWLLVLMAALVSGAVLIFWLLPALRKSKYFLIITGSILAFHFLLAAGFMLYFFHVNVSSDVTVVPTTVKPN